MPKVSHATTGGVIRDARAFRVTSCRRGVIGHGQCPQAKSGPRRPGARGLCHDSAPHAVEMVVRLGFDWVLTDCEHGAIDLESVELMAMAASNAGCVPIGRPSSTNPEAIARMMDRGIAGVQVPHVSTPQQAQTVVESVKLSGQGAAEFGSGHAVGRVRIWRKSSRVHTAIPCR